ncbi:hypothetical protein FRC20_006566 [Serendipita sp. 405]|nr:hypothetical protein FRC20_006566 [Serendipita sp. 405]
MDQVKISKRDLNRIVLDYLIVEGYQSAAESFAEEAASDLPTNAAQQVEGSSIELRSQIREAAEQGDIQMAIELCNDFNPEILDSRPDLHFHLLVQSLIELIRDGRTTEGLEFARRELAPRAERNEAFLKELEDVMCLLVYGAASSAGAGKDKGKTGPKQPSNIDAPPSLLKLLSPQQRIMTASELNDALSSSLSLGGSHGETMLASLIRLCSYGENVLQKQGVEFPRMKVPRSEVSRMPCFREMNMYTQLKSQLVAFVE